MNTTIKKPFYTIAEAGALLYPKSKPPSQISRVYDYLKKGRLAEYKTTKIIEANGAKYRTNGGAKLICAISLARFQRTRRGRAHHLRKPCQVSKKDGSKFECGADVKRFASLGAAARFLGVTYNHISRKANGRGVRVLAAYNVEFI